jgi:hypothetical protein
MVIAKKHEEGLMLYSALILFDFTCDGPTFRNQAEKICIAPPPSPFLFKKITSLSNTHKVQSIPANKLRDESLRKVFQKGIFGQGGLRTGEEQRGRRIVAGSGAGISDTEKQQLP